MKGALIARFVCLLLLWLLLCYIVLKTRDLNFWTLFVVVTSGIVIFVPLYKKYIRDGKGRK
ncbi:MAG: hypothetical protein LUC85_00290 [Bacteroidales bacterium]|nr:hypothetical protein [Bacteroidales bacterium]MCD8393258.1 hypothetical protein [Bacteroidales bacterium]